MLTKPPFLAENELLVCEATDGSEWQSCVVRGPMPDFETAWSRVTYDDVDEIVAVYRMSVVDNFCEDITEECAAAWLRLNDDPAYLKEAPAFVDRDEAEAMFEAQAREGMALREDVQFSWEAGRV